MVPDARKGIGVNLQRSRVCRSTEVSTDLLALVDTFLDTSAVDAAAGDAGTAEPVV